MAYIKAHHPEAAPYIADKIPFIRADSSDKRKIGYSRATYSGAGWTVTVGHAATAELVYDISADYTSGKITWNGTSKDGYITELSYNRAEVRP